MTAIRTQNTVLREAHDVAGRPAVRSERALFRTVEQLGLLKRFQRDFNALTGLTLDFVDLKARASLRLKASERFTPFCRLIRQSIAGRQACARCDAEAIRRLQSDSRPRLYPCHLGLMDIVVPLIFGQRMVGALATGQFLLQSPTRERFRQLQCIIRSFRISTRKAEKEYLRVPVLSSKQADAVIDLLGIIAEHLVKMEVPATVLSPLHASDQLRRAQQFIEVHYLENISLKDVAAAAHLSPSRLAHLFQEKLGTCFVAYRNELRIERAKFLLANTDLRIIEITIQSGFSNLGNFNQQFRRRMGMSPRQYRAQHVSDGL